MNQAERPSIEGPAGEAGFEADRYLIDRSATRLKVAFTLFVVAMLLALSGLTFSMVTRIFDRLTPSTRADLEWKARRGAQELARSTQLGMVVGDSEAIRQAAVDYLTDPEVVGLVVRDAAKEVIFSHGRGSYAPLEAGVFSGREAVVHDAGDTLYAWARSDIEGGTVGHVAIAVSKARLRAGEDLRSDIMAAGAWGTLIALVLTVIFVGFYIEPILRTTRRTFEKLEETTEAALAATRLKSEFLANMSHEIRTPMNGIIGVIDLIRRTPLSPKQLRYVQTIDSSARSLLTIINDILDFSKLEAGKYEMQQADLDPLQLVQEVGELLAPKAHGKGLELVQRVDPDVPSSIVGDIERIKQVLTNLVGNAIKFTETGHVLVRVRRASEADEQGHLQLRFEVTDTGAGISAEAQTRLFAMFSQVDGSLTRQHGGTGLGLAISKRLAEAMGGEIGVQSDVGQGSTFWFTIRTRAGSTERGHKMPERESNVLVIVRDEAQRENLMATLQAWGMRGAAALDAKHGCELILHSDPDPFDLAIIDSFEENDPSTERLFDLCALEALPLVRLMQTTDSPPEGAAELPQVLLTKPVRVSELYNGIISLLDGVNVQPVGPEPANDTQTRRRRKSAKILVVDDNEINRLVACDLLSELGYSSETVENGAEALERARSGGFAAILMDCQMPVMDGYQATQAIRELPGELGRVPIIAATAHAMAGDREKVLEAGMDDYTAKPIRARALERLLARWVQSAAEAEPDDAQDEAAAGGASSRPWADQPLLDESIPRGGRLVEAFLRCTPGDLEAVLEAAHEGDLEVLRRAAHKLKGGSLSLGANQLAEVARHIELQAAEGHIDPTMEQELRAVFERTRELLAVQPARSTGGP